MDQHSRIAALAVRQEEHEVRVVFTDEERDAMRRDHFKKMVEIARLNEAFKLVKMKHKEDTTPIERKSKELFRDIRNGYKDVTMECFLVDDQERGVMEYYDANGVKVDERKLYPEERQTRVRFEQSSTERSQS
jgi:hypothetical protein